MFTSWCRQPLWHAPCVTCPLCDRQTCMQTYRWIKLWQTPNWSWVQLIILLLASSSSEESKALMFVLFLSVLLGGLQPWIWFLASRRDFTTTRAGTMQPLTLNYANWRKLTLGRTNRMGSSQKSSHFICFPSIKGKIFKMDLDTSVLAIRTETYNSHTATKFLWVCEDLLRSETTLEFRLLFDGLIQITKQATSTLQRVRWEPAGLSPVKLCFCGWLMVDGWMRTPMINNNNEQTYKSSCIQVSVCYCTVGACVHRIAFPMLCSAA